MTMRHIRFIALAPLLVLAPLARAQDHPDAVRALDALRTTYSSQIICERVGVEIMSPGPSPAIPTRRTRSSIIVRMSPAKAEAPGADDDGRTIALELGQLRVIASNGVIRAAHASNRSTYAQWSLSTPGAQLTSDDLDKALPSVLAPEIDLGARTTGVLRNLGSYARGITWTAYEQDPASPQPGQPVKQTISGAFEHGTVKLHVAGGRLRTMLIERPAQQISMTLTFSNIGPCDPLKSAIDPATRTLVPGLDELRPKGYTLRLGVRTPELPLTRVSGEKWLMEEILAPPPGTPAAEWAQADHAVLVFVRALRPGVTTSLPRFDAKKLAALLGPMREQSFKPQPKTASGLEDGTPHLARFGLAPVLVVQGLSADDLLSRLRQAGEVWGRDVMWTTDPQATIDLFAPGGEAAIAVLDSERVLRGIVVVEPEMTTEQVADQVAALLFEVAPAER